MFFLSLGFIVEEYKLSNHYNSNKTTKKSLFSKFFRLFMNIIVNLIMRSHFLTHTIITPLKLVFHVKNLALFSLLDHIRIQQQLYEHQLFWHASALYRNPDPILYLG